MKEKKNGKFQLAASHTVFIIICFTSACLLCFVYDCVFQENVIGIQIDSSGEKMRKDNVREIY